MQVKKAGSIDIFFSLILLFVFSIASMGLAFSSANGFRRLEKDKCQISELAIAMSYLNTKVRQNDSLNSIRTETSPSQKGKALVITEVYDSAICETWIFWDNGQLRESLVFQGDTEILDASSPIAKIGGMDVTYKQSIESLDKIEIHLVGDSEREPKQLTLSLFLRT